MYTTVIRADYSKRYLQNALPEGELPKNCLFDKVLTGCGGTYVALKSREFYIIAVPTKALVKDKMTSPTYQGDGLQAVSEDYPLRNRNLKGSPKILVTYKSLPKLCQSLDISQYNPLIDEVHMLSSMTGYARDELAWIMENFRKFKSFCFMSATVPRRTHLLPELKDIPKVSMEWEGIVPTTFNCFLTDNAQESILHTMLQHIKKESKGTPYFFYNSVIGICSIIKKWRSQSKYPAVVNVVCSDIDKNRKALAKIGLSIGAPNDKADVHFITATAFEGVDFYDPEGVTYVVSDKSYTTTKYSIETTIPQIVGRLRDSKYNSSVTVLFNKHDPVISMTPREFEDYLDVRESQAKSSIKVYNDLLAKFKTDRSLALSVQGQLSVLINDPNVLVANCNSSFESLVLDYEVKEGDFPKAEFYPYARVVAQQTYDLFHEERYVRGDQQAAGDPLSLGKLRGLAPGLTKDEASLFKIRQPSLKTLCQMYQEDSIAFSQQHPDWYEILQEITPEVCASYGYKKIEIKKLFKAKQSLQTPKAKPHIYRVFKVGKFYSSKYIKTTLTNLGIQGAKATTLKKWFELKSCTRKGVAGYEVIRKVPNS